MATFSDVKFKMQIELVQILYKVIVARKVVITFLDNVFSEHAWVSKPNLKRVKNQNLHLCDLQFEISNLVIL